MSLCAVRLSAKTVRLLQWHVSIPYSCYSCKDFTVCVEGSLIGLIHNLDLFLWKAESFINTVVHTLNKIVARLLWCRRKRSGSCDWWMLHRNEIAMLSISGCYIDFQNFKRTIFHTLYLASFQSKVMCGFLLRMMIPFALIGFWDFPFLSLKIYLNFAKPICFF